MQSVYVYTRVSSKSQGEMNNVSLDAQLQKCVEYLGGQPTAVFSEKSSGRILDHQKELMRLAQIVSNGDMIIVYNVSRFTRDSIRGFDLLNTFNRRRISVVSVMDGINSLANRVSFRMKLVEANEESDVISDRVTGAIEFIKKCGGHIGVAPYGYMTVRSESVAVEGGTYRPLILESNPSEMSIIKRIIYYVENRTELDDIIEQQPPRFRVGICNMIADTFNNEGLTRRGKMWTPGSVKALYKKFKDDISHESIENDEGQLCEICHEGHSEKGNEMVLCDTCDKGYHIECIHVRKVPKNAFYCSVMCQYSTMKLEE